MKVHPLDFKSMNITAELKSKDPACTNFWMRWSRKNALI
jgi:hypothetical protein